MARTVRTKVAGVTYENANGEQRQDLIKRHCAPDADLTLIREPDNPHGSTAIAVFCDGHQIGYLKSELSQEFAPRMDSGLALRAKVLEVTGGDGQTYGVNIVLIIPEPGENASDTTDLVIPRRRKIETRLSRTTGKNADGEDRQELIEMSDVGDELTLGLEEDYNSDWELVKVIKVFTSAYSQIGVLPGAVTDEIAPLLEAGYEATAKILQITGGEDGKTLGVKILITVPDERSAASLESPVLATDAGSIAGIGGGGSAPAVPRFSDKPATEKIKHVLGWIWRAVVMVFRFFWPKSIKNGWVRIAWFFLAWAIVATIVNFFSRLLAFIF